MTSSIQLLRRFCILGAAALLIGAGPALAQTKIDMTIFHAENTPWTPTIKWWIAEVDKETEGRVKIVPHFAGTLAPLSETLKTVRNGAVPAGLITAGAVSGQLRYLGYAEAITGLPVEPAKLNAALTALRPVLEQQLREVGLEYLWSQTSGGLISVCRNKHLKTLADWKNTKVRTGGRWQAEQIKSIGASPLSLDPSELYIALQNGTIDCTLSIAILASSLKLDQVAPKVTFLQQSNNLSLFVMNKDVFNSLSEKDRAAIRRVSIQADQRSVKDVMEAQAAGVALLSKVPGNAYQLSNAEHIELRNALGAALAPLEAESGAPGQQVKKILDTHR